MRIRTFFMAVVFSVFAFQCFAGPDDVLRDLLPEAFENAEGISVRDGKARDIEFQLDGYGFPDLSLRIDLVKMTRVDRLAVKDIRFNIRLKRMGEDGRPQFLQIGSLFLPRNSFYESNQMIRWNETLENDLRKFASEIPSADLFKEDIQKFFTKNFGIVWLALVSKPLLIKKGVDPLADPKLLDRMKDLVQNFRDKVDSENKLFIPETADRITFFTALAVSLALEAPAYYSGVEISPMAGGLKVFTNVGLGIFTEILWIAALLEKPIPRWVKPLEKPFLRAAVTTASVGLAIQGCSLVLRHLH